MEIVDSLVFFLSAIARYIRNLLDSCGYVAGEISDIRYEPDVERILRPEWAIPAWIGVIVVSVACFAYVAYAEGAIHLLGSFLMFGLGYWLFDKILRMTPQADSQQFIRMIHRRLKDRSNAEVEPELKRSYSNLADRIEFQLGDKLR